MARDGNGTMNLPHDDFTAGTVIVSDDVDENFDHIKNELTNSIACDGQSVITADIPFGGQKITGLGSGTAATDGANLGQVQAQAYAWATTGGTADAIALTVSPAITAYAAGQTFRFQAGADNTGAVTVAVSGLTTKAIENNGTALAAGDIKDDEYYEIVYDGTAFQINRLSTPSEFMKTLLDDADASTARATLGVPDPPVSTDNAIARYDGASGALQNSSVVIDDNGRGFGDSSADAAMWGGALGSLKAPPNNDLDDVDTLGWHIATGSTTNNVPVAAGFWFVLTTGDSNLFQMALRLGDASSVYSRTRNSGVWSSWTQVLVNGAGITLTAGYLSDSYDGGEITTGTYTPAPATGEENFQHITNGGAFTLAPPASPCTVVLEITNNSNAGAITTSGFTQVDGDAFTTDDGDDFICYITKTANFSHLSVKALQ